MNRWRCWNRQIRALPWLSPGSFVLCAMTAAAVFAALHLLGWRESTTILCGTQPAGRTAQAFQSFQAVSYVMFYMATVILTPILLIAAAVFQWLLPRQCSESGVAEVVQAGVEQDQALVSQS